MRRPLAAIVLLIFAATSEGATLCLRSDTVPTIAANHACCPEQATLAKAENGCCTDAPAISILTPRSRCADSSALAATQYSLLPNTAAVATAPMWQVTHVVVGSSSPLYLQHLALLI